MWVDDAYPACECGSTTVRLWKAAGSGRVIGDDIPGGVEIRHGICHDDGSPRRFYSKSEMKRVAAMKGLANVVMHTTDPKSGSDRAPHTSRWV